MSDDKIKILKKDPVYLFNGSLCKASEVVGHCNSMSHHGYISKNLLKKHRCLEKECVQLVKFNPDFWEGFEKRQLDAEQRKEKWKRKKALRTNRNRLIYGLLSDREDIFTTQISERNDRAVIGLTGNSSSPILKEVKKRVSGIYNQKVYFEFSRSKKSTQRQIVASRKSQHDLLLIPGVGKATKRNLQNIGYFHIEDLIHQDPEMLYRKDRDLRGKKATMRDRNIYRKAVRYASDKRHLKLK
ncbi:MAG: helix-hairpin-helix domain-containing protein [Coriobacteriia bacterium]|nr:helix-hairpin-helix domain-containing protein [Coriobacteriia bacterium]MCL2537322.1 helix-hairpin-helix domain-containing protein [Coriobacteriia bacterium]